MSISRSRVPCCCLLRISHTCHGVKGFPKEKAPDRCRGPVTDYQTFGTVRNGARPAAGVGAGGEHPGLGDQADADLQVVISAGRSIASWDLGAILDRLAAQLDKLG